MKAVQGMDLDREDQVSGKQRTQLNGSQRDGSMKKGIYNEWELQMLRARGERERDSETCRDVMGVMAGYTW